MVVEQLVCTASENPSRQMHSKQPSSKCGCFIHWPAGLRLRLCWAFVCDKQQTLCWEGLFFSFQENASWAEKKSCVPLVINYVKSKVGPHESSQFPCENFQQRYTGSYSHTNMPGKENWKWPTVAKEQRLGEKLCRCPSVFRPQLSLWPFLFNIVAGGCNLSVGTACAICKNP